VAASVIVTALTVPFATVWWAGRVRGKTTGSAPS
jgi:hypothetical protein